MAGEGGDGQGKGREEQVCLAVTDWKLDRKVAVCPQRLLLQLLPVMLQARTVQRGAAPPHLYRLWMVTPWYPCSASWRYTWDTTSGLSYLP